MSQAKTPAAPGDDRDVLGRSRIKGGTPRGRGPRLALVAGVLSVLAAPVWWYGVRTGGGDREAQAEPAGRMLEVRWLGVPGEGLPVEIAPLQPVTRVAIGAKGKVVFRFRNRAEGPVAFQAVHHVAPGPALEHFRKYECFCFKQQRLGPGETRDMPVGFRFDDALPKGVRQITVSYTLFPLDAGPHAGHDHSNERP